MKTEQKLFALSLCILFACTMTTEQENIQAPVATKISKELKTHGDIRIDNYYWMNDREDPKVIEYLNQENAYTDQVMKPTEALQADLYKEIRGRIKEEDESVPYKHNGYYYYTRTVEGKEYAVYCRKKGTLEADEEILLDVNTLAEGHDYFEIGDLSVSPNNKLVAYTVDTVSRRQYNIYFKNLETGELFTDAIEKTNGEVTWANDNKTVFYAKNNETTLRSEKIFRHTLGQENSADDLVFFEEDEAYYTDVSRSKSGEYLIIQSESTLSSEIRILSSDTPLESFRIVQEREEEMLYSISHFKDEFYILTNWEAPNFRLMKTKVLQPNKENWTEVIATRPDVLLESIDIFNDYLIVEEVKSGLPYLRIMPWNGEGEHYLDFGEEVYSASTTENFDFDSHTLRYSYASLTTPSSTFDYDLKTRNKTLLKQQEVVGGTFSPDQYEAKRLWATASDGTKIPMSVVYKKGIELNGSNPLYITGYGSYGYSYPIHFSSSRLSLLDRGFVYAIAHIRGGQEMGRQWYEDGKYLKKKNTFTDFIDCTKYLQAEKYSSPELTFANGGSAGGLLMGAIANMSPQTYHAIIADVPFVDVVTTMLDESIPLTTGEFDEWGNPKNKEYYDYMLTYSPYDQVKSMDYPHMLVTTGLHDSQVQYWEPAKWVAKLRDMKTDSNDLLFKINMDYGHSGASGRFQWIHELALEYAFVLNHLEK